MIDNDISRFTEELLRAWKLIAEDRALNSIGKTAPEAGTKLAPRLELYLECLGVKQDIHSRDPVRYFVLGLKNGEACGTAKFPSIRYRRACGLVVNRYGIDGNDGFGLPQSPSDNEWEIFRGGADQVIHSGETLKVTQLMQRGRNLDAATIRLPFPVIRTVNTRWLFDSVTFQCEISAEGVGAVNVEKPILEQHVSWSM